MDDLQQEKCATKHNRNEILLLDYIPNLAYSFQQPHSSNSILQDLPTFSSSCSLILES